jgi:poly(3-hydroxybutyrate) depolymerase
MLASLLLATMLQRPSLEAARSDPIASSSIEESRIRAALAFFEHGPGYVGPNGTAESSIGSGTHATTPSGGPTEPTYSCFNVPGYPGVFNVILYSTGSGYQEQFLIQPAAVAPGNVAPLLVVFHGAGVSHYSGLLHTTFFQEARNRGWHVISPLGALQNNFGFLEGQINTRQALAWTMPRFPIDPARVYAVGFSMGGGWELSQAARHLGSSEVHFAAILNHTGGVSLPHTYENDLGAQPFLESRFGGTPQQEPFAYQRCSSIVLDTLTGNVGADTDMIRNLAHVPIRNWMADMDPLTYLTQQMTALHGHEQGMNATEMLTVVPAAVHSWSTLDETITCDWLATHTLTPLPPATYQEALIDQDGSYFDFALLQDAPGAFSRFEWKFDLQASGNRLTIHDTANLKEAAIDATDLGLAYSGTLELELQVADTTPDRIVLQNVPVAPLTVTRDLLPISFTHDPLTHEVVIIEPGTDATAHLWKVEFP